MKISRYDFALALVHAIVSGIWTGLAIVNGGDIAAVVAVLNTALAGWYVGKMRRHILARRAAAALRSGLSSTPLMLPTSDTGNRMMIDDDAFVEDLRRRVYGLHFPIVEVRAFEVVPQRVVVLPPSSVLK